MSSESSEAPRQLSRRRLLQVAGAGAAAAVTSGLLAACSSDHDPGSAASSAPSSAPDRSARRNILVIYADDQRSDTPRYMPTLQRLASERGTTFRQARQSSPLCTPSRATLLRGQMATGPHGHGLVTNGSGLGRLAPESLAPWLAAAGYHCGLAGKYFANAYGKRVAPGWQWWRAFVGTGGSGQEANGYSVFDGAKTVRPTVHQTEYLTDQAVGFVRTAREPWFLWDCPTSPHIPFEPTPRHASDLAQVEWPVVDGNPTGKPSWITSLPPVDPGTVAAVRSSARDMLREVLDLDDHLAAVWAALVASGRADRTTVIYSSDNGTALLEHRLPADAKNLPYEVSCRVPLVCIGKGFAPGTTVDAPASAAIDITATCLAIAGGKATVPEDGISLLDLAADPARHAGRVVLGSCSASDDPRIESPACDWVVVDRGDGLRKLIRYREAAAGDEYEAYDLDTDPNELRNWANDTDRRTERDALETALDGALG